MNIPAIQTRYAGCHFRSRLEARWAVFFDQLGIAWEYEAQGYTLPSGRRYLPDFLLTECGTYVEVKGDESALDVDLLYEAARHLPYIHRGGEPCYGILLLGPIPRPGEAGQDWGWRLLNNDPTIYAVDALYGFGSYTKNRRPWYLDNARPDGNWLAPVADPNESGVPAAYVAARSARFEHGQSGAAR